MPRTKGSKNKPRDFKEKAKQQVQAKQQSHVENGDDSTVAPSGQRILELEIKEIKDNPYQPRRQFDETLLKELAGSIQNQGLLNPVLVHKGEDGYYLVAGERRLRACKSLGMDTIKAIEVEGDPEIASLVDNIQRDDLHPMERALAVSRLYEKYKKNSRKVAEAISKSENTVQRLLKLSRLPDRIIATGEEDTTERLTNNRIPLREFFELMRIEEQDALNAKLKQLEQKYSQEPKTDPILRRATASKDEMDKYLSVAEKMLNLMTNDPPRRDDKRLGRLKDELENILRKIEDILQDEFVIN